MKSTSAVVLSSTGASVTSGYEYYADYSDYNYNNSSPDSDQFTNMSGYAIGCRGQLAVTDWVATKMLLGMLYTTVFIVAVSGNSLVVYVVMSNRNMQTVTNLFITNLAISDLLVNFTSLWLTPIYTYIGHWVWGGWLCYGLPLFQGTSIFISTLTLTAIAIDRYIVIVHPLKRRISVQVCIAVITFIWTLSLLLVMPYAVHMRMTFIPKPCSFFLCIEDWANDNLKSIYGMIVMSLQFVVPFVIIGFCYVCIWTFLEHRQTMVNNNRRTTEADLQRKRRLLRMLVSMVVIFAMCWFPFNALNIMRDFQLDKPIKHLFSFLFLLAHVISMSATCWNPILYAWMNENFRREFKAALPCCFSKVERVNQSTLTRMGSQYRATIANGDSALDLRPAILSADTRSVASADVHERVKAYADKTNGLRGDAANGHEQAPLLSSREPMETNL